MTDLQPHQGSAPVVHTGAPGDELILPLIGWVLVLFGWGVVGAIIAYVDRDKGPPFVRDSYRYLIRTFWIGWLVLLLLFVGVAGGFFAAGSDPGGMLGVGVMTSASIVMLAYALWHLARCVKAIVLLARRRPIRRPGTWLV